MGNSPKNARIKIDYSGIKPKATFSYPAKPEQFAGSMFHHILLAWLLLFGIIFASVSFSQNLDDELYKLPEMDSYEECLEVYSLNYTITHSEWYCDKKYNWDFFQKFKHTWFKPLIIILIVFIPPILIYRPFKKQWVNFYPKYQGFKAKKKEATFKPEDIKKDYEGNWFCEIPLFENIVLDYEAKKDFSRQLKFFEIREHKFKYLKVERMKINKKRVKKRKKVNEWLWYAKFYFKEKPKDGCLKVVFA